MNDNFDFKIVDKNGKIVEDVSFKDYDQLADYMLGVADQWYQGLRDPQDSYSLTQTAPDGSVRFEEEKIFGGSDVSDLPDNGTEVIESIRELERKSEQIREAYGEDP